MTLTQYWVILLKQWKLVLICFVLVGLGTYVGSKLMKPIYQSTALVQVTVLTSNNQADYNSLLASDQLVQTESQLATSDPVLREVASHYPGMSVDMLSKVVVSTVRANTQLFEIDVQDANPTRAAMIANDIAATLIQQQLQLTQQGNSSSQQQIQEELTATRQQIDATITDITNDTSQIANLRAQAGKEAQIAGLQTQVTLLQTQLSGLQQHYSAWQTILAQLELTQAQNSDLLHIVQAAQPATVPVRPQTLLYTAAGLVAGLCLGMLLAILFEQLDISVRSTEALMQLVDWPILATIWRVNSSKERKELVNPKGPNANIESYRILRTNIGFSLVDKPLRSIMVTSAVPQEGKSTIAANLAIFMAKAGKNTVLVDADLRRPTIQQLFGLAPEKKGLSNAILALSAPSASDTSPSTPIPVRPLKQSLTGAVALEPFLHSVNVPNLRIMPAGPLPPNPPELLDSRAMERLFNMLAMVSGAEVIIFDTPPLLGLSDASILAKKVDGAVIVVDITRTNKKYLKQLKASLTQAGANVLGCVVNKQRHGRKDATYSHYYYYGNEERNSIEKGAENASTQPAQV